MKVAIVGSRGFTDSALVERTVKALLDKHSDLVIVSGGAAGADTLAARAGALLGVRTITHWPEWEKFGKSAGFKRNALIVADADLVIAFFAPGPRSKGTANTVALALGASKPTRIYHEGRWTNV